MATKTLDVATLSDINLVNIVNETEGFAWRLNHDAADDRIPNDKGVDDSIKELMQTRDRAVEEIKRRTRLQTHEQLRDYVKGKLKEQDEMWDRQWAELYQEGAVFKISGGGRYSKDCPNTFETVRAYLPTRGTIGPNQYILSRIHYSNRFMTFDDRDIPELTRLEDVQPQYKGKTRRGLIKATEEMAKREIARHKNTNGKLWHLFYDTGAVFTHAGFNDTFEAFQHFNIPNTERKTRNEVILARSYSQPVFVEFTPRDLGALELSSVTPKYTRKEGNTTYAPALTLD